MEALGAGEIVLAGFDGFSININDNYYNPTMRKPVTEEQAVRRNQFYKELIASIGTHIPVTFLTPSLYQ